MLIKKRKNPLFTLWELNGSSFEQTWIPFTQGCIVPNLVEIGPAVLEKKFFLISSMYFHYLVIIFPWKMVGPFIWTNLNPLYPRMLCAKFEIGPVVRKKNIFLILSMYFCYFIIISPWKRAWPFIWTTLNPLHPRMLYAKFGWNWPGGLWEEIFKFRQCNFGIL